MTFLHLLHFFGLNLLRHTRQLHVKLSDFVHFHKFVLIFDRHLVTFLNLVQGCFNFRSDWLVLNLGLKEFCPELVAIALLHLLHGPKNLFVTAAFTDGNEVVGRLSLLIHHNVHNVIELRGQTDDRVGCIYFRHEVVEVVHDVVLHLLQILDLCVDVVQSVNSGVCIKQYRRFAFFLHPD